MDVVLHLEVVPQAAACPWTAPKTAVVAAAVGRLRLASGSPVRQPLRPGEPARQEPVGLHSAVDRAAEEATARGRTAAPFQSEAAAAVED